MSRVALEKQIPEIYVNHLVRYDDGNNIFQVIQIQGDFALCRFVQSDGSILERPHSIGDLSWLDKNRLSIYNRRNRL